MSVSEGVGGTAGKAGTAARAIELVEPTLASEAGHCYALLRSLHGAAPALSFRVWADAGAELPSLPAGRVLLQRHFHRRWRKVQALLLYRRLLAAGTPLLVPTASWFDLRALDLAARLGGGPSRIAPGRAFLYFHKLRLDPGRARALAALARRQPDLDLYGTSPEIVDRLREAGFPQVRRVVPVLAPEPAGGPAQAQPFRTLLFAGAARADKGFGRVVDLVELLAREGDATPILVQASGDHYGRHDEQTAADIARLRAIAHPALTILDTTPGPAQYAALFPGSICLQPYTPSEYADKMSAVTYDALRAGAPIITTDGTSMAQVVRETGAGRIVAGDADAGAMAAAVRETLRDYAGLQQRALVAGEELRPSRAWAPMVERLGAA